jgi:hypothetical protein
MSMGVVWKVPASLRQASFCATWSVLIKVTCETSQNHTWEPYVSMGRTTEMKIFRQETRLKPLIELPKTPSPFTMLRAWVLIVFTCAVQSSRGVKMTPRYRSERAGVILTSVSSGRCKVIVLGGKPCCFSCFGVRFGWKNITSHFSLSIVKPDWWSHENTWLAAWVSFAAVPAYVGLDVKMFPSST